MTSRELYEYALIELNKLEAPSLLLEDYNYFINKAVQQYINLIYAKLELDQQSVDDLRVLKTSTILTPEKLRNEETIGSIVNNTLMGNFYYADLPADYLHLINCIVEYKVQKSNFKCYDKDDSVYFAARRLTSDMYAQIINNAYLRPTYKRPYYYLNNINQRNQIVTDSKNDDKILNYNKGSYIDSEHTDDETDTSDSTVPSGTNWDPNSSKYKDSNLVDAYNTAGDRLANPGLVRLELRFGRDDSIFKPVRLYIDYVKAPMYIRLTQEQIDSTLDYSQVLEFPDYVCFEIVNIFTRLLMENASDPRLQTNMPINNTIANPVLQQQAAAQNNK